jgi:hypothetical protein
MYRSLSLTVLQLNFTRNFSTHFQTFVSFLSRLNLKLYSHILENTVHPYWKYQEFNLFIAFEGV